MQINKKTVYRKRDQGFEVCFPLSPCDSRSRGLDSVPCAAVAGLGHQRIRLGRGGRHALPSRGRQSFVQDDQRRHDEAHVGLQCRHPALAPQLPPTE